MFSLLNRYKPEKCYTRHQDMSIDNVLVCRVKRNSRYTVVTAIGAEHHLLHACCFGIPAISTTDIGAVITFFTVKWVNFHTGYVTATPNRDTGPVIIFVCLHGYRNLKNGLSQVRVLTCIGSCIGSSIGCFTLNFVR